MAQDTKEPGTRRVTFNRADYEKFAEKIGEWGSSLSPEERALLMAVLDKGSTGIRQTSGEPVQTAVTLSAELTSDFDLAQFVVRLLLALKGISAEVDEDGPSWVEEITWAKT